MTHDRVTDFAASLVEMARSHELVPKLQDHIHNLEEAHRIDGDTIARLEIRIMEMKDTQDAITKKLREVEMERDDASFRLLEAEDRIATIRSVLGTAQVALGNATALVEEPKAEPAKPTEDGELGNGSHVALNTSASSAEVATTQEPMSGQSELRPLEDVTAEQSVTGQSDASALDVGQSEPLPSVPSIPTQSPPVGEAPAETVENASQGESAEGPTATVTTGEQVNASTLTVENTANADTTTQSDDVGYHNEPTPEYSVDWWKWSHAMDNRYGHFNWPARKVA